MQTTFYLVCLFVRMDTFREGEVSMAGLFLKEVFYDQGSLRYTNRNYTKT